MQDNVNYFASILYVDTCSVCTAQIADESKTLDAIFTWKGYSYAEVEMGGSFSVAQCFYINKDALTAYTQATGNSFKFGVLAAGNKDGGEIAPVIGVDGQSHEFTSLNHDYFEIKISGITSDNLDTKLVFCAYVVDGEKVFYLDDNATKTALTGKSYNDLAPKAEA